MTLFWHTFLLGHVEYNSRSRFLRGGASPFSMSQLFHKIKNKTYSITLPSPVPHCVPLLGGHQHLSCPTLTSSPLTREEKPDLTVSSPLGQGDKWICTQQISTILQNGEKTPRFSLEISSRKTPSQPQRWERVRAEHMWKTLPVSEGQ